MKRKSVFGLLVASACVLYAGYFCYQVYFGLSVASYDFGGLEQYVYSFNKMLVDAFLKGFIIFTVIAAAIAMISYFTGFHWGYLIAAMSLVTAFFSLPSGASPTSPLIIVLWALCIFLIAAFYVDHRLYRSSEKNTEHNDSSMNPPAAADMETNGSMSNNGDSNPV